MQERLSRRPPSSLRPGPRHALTAIALTLLLAVVPVAQSPSHREASSFLTERIGFAPGDLEALHRGGPLVKILESADAKEVAAFGAIRVSITSEFFLSQFRRITTFKQSEHVLQIGRFSDPPRAADLHSLTVDGGDLDALARCRAAQCGIQLGSEYMARFRTADDSARGEERRAGAATLLRDMLAQYAAAYVVEGNAALMEYHHKAAPVRMSQEVHAILQARPRVADFGPELLRYLAEFPGARPAGAEDFIYWSKEDIGFHPVISMTHVTIHTPLATSSADVLVASKQIYASRYFDGSLGLAALVRGTCANEPCMVLMYENHSRTAFLRGRMGPILRPLVHRGVKHGLAKELRAVKERLEVTFRTAGMT